MEATDSFHDFQDTAFFADCEHEVKPVRSGYRCCLVYNLSLDKGDPAALNLALDAQARTLLAPLATMKDERSGELTAVLLEHSYTEANLSIKNLKGNDEDLTLGHWRNSRDRCVDLGSYRVEKDGLVSKEEIDDGDPDEQESEGYTGNAGWTMDHWYRRAAIVLWPAEDHEHILYRYNFRQTCPCATPALIPSDQARSRATRRPA